MKKSGFLLIFYLLLGIGCIYGEDKIRVVTTLPDLRSIAEYVGGDRVVATALSRGYQDPHYVTPKPSLMAAVAKADLFVEIGLDLELWTERILDGARNAKVRVGAPGHVYAYEGIAILQRPKVISRSEGDLHPQGNPHIWLDPLNGKRIAANIAEGLKRVDPGHAAAYEANRKAFGRKIDEKLFGQDLVRLLGGSILDRLARKAELIPFLEEKEFQGEKLIDSLGGWLGESEAFRGKKVLTFHQSWIYFTRRFGLSIAGTIEEKPGIPPSAQRREFLIRKVRDEHIQALIVSTYYDPTVPRAIESATGAKMVVLPVMTGGTEAANNYFALFDTLIATLRQAF